MPKSKHRKEQKVKSAKRGQMRAEFRGKTQKMYKNMWASKLNSRILEAQNASQVVADAPTELNSPLSPPEIGTPDLDTLAETHDHTSVEAVPSV